MGGDEKGGDEKVGAKEILQAVNALAETAKNQQVQIDSIMGVAGNSGAGLGDVGGEGGDDGVMTNPYEPEQSDNAQLELARLCFNTPRDKLPELTETPRMQVTCTSFVEAMNEYIANMGTEEYEPLSAIFIRQRDRRMKSVGRKSLMEALAFSQIQQEKREIDESQQQGF